MLRFFKKNAFVLALLLFFILSDLLISLIDPINHMTQFYKNDFEKTRILHPKPVWQKAFFGNSAVIASYMESQSKSGYINMGINYGKLTDLNQILHRRLAVVSEDLVIGLNFFTLMDDLPTDPYYIWNRKPFEPYVYFYRDQFKKLITDTIESKLKGTPINTRLDTLTIKQLYFGRLNEEKLDEKAKEYEEKYGHKTLDDFKNNLAALEEIIKYCRQQDIRLRVLWMPWNPYDQPPAYVDQLKQQVNGILQEQDIEFSDWTDKMDSRYFHDLGHLNIGEGAPLFTKEVDLWLTK